MPLTKKQWLNQTVMCDEWGRPPSLADVPLTYMSRDKAFKKQSKNPSKKDIDTLYKKYLSENN
tara:strand:- start:624 stop:812 length:189 start_codon:yes stop_codon:yes gene_type:complete